MEQHEHKTAAVPLKNEPWRLGVQLWTNLLVATILCAIVTLSLSNFMVGGIWGKILVEVICMSITVPMLYGQMWTHGDRDANFVQFGRMEPAPLKGLWSGLMGAALPFVLNIPLALSMLRILPFDFMPIYRVLNAPIWGFINMVHPEGGAIPHEATPAIPATDTMPEISAMPATDGLSWGGFAIIALLPLIYVAISAVAYYLGTKRFSIVTTVVYKGDLEAAAAHRRKKAENKRRRR